VEAQFNPEMQAGFPESSLRATWAALVGQLGPYQRTGEVWAAADGAYVIVLAETRFALQTVRLQFTLDASDRVAGFWARAADYLLPGMSPAATSLPSYVVPESFSETEVTVGAAPWQLPGTLTMPNGSGPFPAVVLVAGSGPNDRDETAGPNKPFRDLAWGLASHGVASLRYDKRTLIHGASMLGLPTTVKEEVVDDALAAIAVLRSTPGVDPDAVFLAGHSLGGYLAPRIAGATTHLRGLVILEGPTRPLEQLILDQYEYLASLTGSPRPEALAQIEAIRAQVALVESAGLSTSTPAEQLPLGIPAVYWLDLRGYNPAAVAASSSLPIFICQGGRDYQVTTADFDGWKRSLQSRTDVSFHFYENVNHLLMEGSGPPTPAEYQQPGHVTPALVADLAAWILAESD
jgi:dienelactone hydrolase